MRSTRQRRTTRSRLLSTLTLLGLVTACTGTPAAGPPTTDGPRSSRPSATGPAVTWTRQPLPDGSTALTLTPAGDRLLVGATVPVDGPDLSHPRMYALGAGGHATAVGLRPGSPYAFLARWYSVVGDGTHVVAIGGATGGAHGNVRWSTWAGTTTDLAEQTQNILTFGGEDAGQLLDAVITPGGPVLVGTWASSVTGQDAAIWLRDNAIWRRQPSTGTALQSTPDLLVGPRSAVASGPGILVVGSAVHLAGGGVAQSAALWRSSGPDSGWHRIDLPDAGATSEAISARCDGPRCLVAGRVDGSLALWSVDGDDASRVEGVPVLAMADSDALPTPVVWAGHDAVVAPGGASAVLLRSSETGWTTSVGPTGEPVRAAVVGSQLWVTTATSAGGASTLWRADG